MNARSLYCLYAIVWPSEERHLDGEVNLNLRVKFDDLSSQSLKTMQLNI